jgi:HlyD family secretion protein
MKRLLPLLIGFGVLVAFVATLAFLVAKAREKPVVYETETPFVTDIVKKAVATGAIVPRNEVEIKSRVSGVVDRLAVEPGDEVQAGDLIAVIRIIPDLGTLASAESTVETARIARDIAKEELVRDEALFAQSALSTAELERSRADHALREEGYRAALRTLRIVREGQAGGSADVSTHIRSTVAGMVLAVEVEAGESVTETNTFNPGTTIATVADMGDMIFEGTVDESEVGKIAEGMALDVTVGALGDLLFKGSLEYISPKGVLDEGAVLFEIEAAITPKEGTFVRAGSSANAAIVLDRRDKVLAVKESVLQFDDGTPYVEVEVSAQVFERRDIEVGLSDGIQIEVVSGLTEQDRVKAGEKGT